MSGDMVQPVTNGMALTGIASRPLILITTLIKYPPSPTKKPAPPGQGVPVFTIGDQPIARRGLKLIYLFAVLSRTTSVFFFNPAASIIAAVAVLTDWRTGSRSRRA
jgi:hypothetical protein